MKKGNNDLAFADGQRSHCGAILGALPRAPTCPQLSAPPNELTPESIHWLNSSLIAHMSLQALSTLVGSEEAAELYLEPRHVIDLLQARPSFPTHS